MATEIGAWVKWTNVSPTRLGYKATDIGKVVVEQWAAARVVSMPVDPRQAAGLALGFLVRWTARGGPLGRGT
jgi:hypothetical protein